MHEMARFCGGVRGVFGAGAQWAGTRQRHAAVGCGYCGSVVKEQIDSRRSETTARFSDASAAASLNSPLLQYPCQSDKEG